jgi:hypothetical protein
MATNHFVPFSAWGAGRTSVEPVDESLGVFNTAQAARHQQHHSKFRSFVPLCLGMLIKVGTDGSDCLSNVAAFGVLKRPVFGPLQVLCSCHFLLHQSVFGWGAALTHSNQLFLRNHTQRICIR